MSFVLQIWELPEGRKPPTTVREATALVMTLHGPRVGQNPKFLRLAQLLTSRHPCIMTPAGREAPAAWSDGPLDGVTDEAVYGIGLTLDLIDEVRPFVIETALSLGLNVEDEQAGEYFLADGSVLSVEQELDARRRTEAAAKSAAPLPSKERLSARVVSDLASVLAKHHFMRTLADDVRGAGYLTTAFRRAEAGNWHQLNVTVGEDADCRDLTVEWIPCHGASSKLRNEIAHGGKPPRDARDYSLGRIHQHAWMEAGHVRLEPMPSGSRRYRMREPAHVAECTGHLAEQIDTRLARLFADFEDAQAFDRLVNPMPVTRSMFHSSYNGGAHHIIAAYLSDNPRLEALCEEFWQKTQTPTTFSEGMRTHLHLCIAYVRRHPRRQQLHL